MATATPIAGMAAAAAAAAPAAAASAASASASAMRITRRGGRYAGQQQHKQGRDQEFHRSGSALEPKRLGPAGAVP